MKYFFKLINVIVIVFSLFAFSLFLFFLHLLSQQREYRTLTPTPILIIPTSIPTMTPPPTPTLVPTMTPTPKVDVIDDEFLLTISYSASACYSIVNASEERSRGTIKNRGALEYIDDAQLVLAQVEIWYLESTWKRADLEEQLLAINLIISDWEIGNTDAMYVKAELPNHCSTIRRIVDEMLPTHPNPQLVLDNSSSIWEVEQVGK